MKQKIIISILALLTTFMSYSQERKAAPPSNLYNIVYSNNCATSLSFRYNITSPAPSGLTYVFIAFDAQGIFYADTITQLGWYNVQNIPIDENSTFSVSLYDSNGYVSAEWSESFTQCINDEDGDGILDDDDLCRFIPGNASNFGCYGNPDLIVNETSEIASPGWGVGQIKDITSGNRIELARYDGFINIYILLLENIGNGDKKVGPVYCEFYISTDTTLSSDDFRFTSNTVTVPGMISGAITPYVPPNNLKAKLFGSTVGNNLSYGNYYLIIAIDKDNGLQGSELVTSNNNYVIPIEYVNYFSPSTSNLNQLASINLRNGASVQLSKSEIKEKNISSENNLDVKIYNMGNLEEVHTFSLNYSDYAEFDLSNLASGMYILHVNDTYIKKFIVK